MIKKHKVFLIAFKYYPVICSTVIFLKLILFQYNVDTPILKTSFNTSIASGIIMYLMSRSFNYCSWHRMLICYCVIYDIVRTTDLMLPPYNEYSLNTLALIFISLIVFYIAFRKSRNGINKNT